METVYLLHFSSPYKRARHYLGWTMHDLEFRLAHHANGTGAGLTRAAAAAGITWQVTRTYRAFRSQYWRQHGAGGFSGTNPEFHPLRYQIVAHAPLSAGFHCHCLGLCLVAPPEITER